MALGSSRRAFLRPHGWLGERGWSGSPAAAGTAQSPGATLADPEGRLSTSTLAWVAWRHLPGGGSS